MSLGLLPVELRLVSNKLESQDKKHGEPSCDFTTGLRARESALGLKSREGIFKDDVGETVLEFGSTDSSFKDGDGDEFLEQNSSRDVVALMYLCPMVF